MKSIPIAKPLLSKSTLFCLALIVFVVSYQSKAGPLEIASTSEPFKAIQSISLPDLSNDGVAEIGLLYLDNAAKNLRLQILDGVSLEQGLVISWNNIYDNPSLHLLPDLNGNSVPEIGVFGVRNDVVINNDNETVDNTGKSQLFARDLRTGQNARVYNWPANWTSVKPTILDDITGDGLVDVAIQGRFQVGNRPQLVVRNGATATSAGTFSYPDLFNEPEFFQHSDVDGDGIGEISTFGRIKRNNKIQIKIANGMNPANRLKSYNFPDKWSDVQWIKLDDTNNDGIGDWGLFGVSKDDNRPQLIVKDGQDPKGALRIFGWSADLSSPQFFAIPDMTGDGVSEVAVGGRRSNGRYQFQVKDGVDRNVSLVNHNINLSLSNVSFHVIDDLTLDGISEIGFLGTDVQNNHILQIQNGNGVDGTVTEYNLGNQWSNVPSVINIADITNDGLAEVLVEGVYSGQSKVQIWAIPDTDSDTYPDTADAFPEDENEWLDTDKDTIGNNADTDDDNDGVDDENDAYPLIAVTGYEDTDGDGIPNDCNEACILLGMMADEDDNGNGIPDFEDIQTDLIDNQISIKLSQVGEGTITVNDDALSDCMDTGTCEYFQLMSQTTEFVAAPADGWEFVRWNNCSSQSGTTCTVNSQNNTSLQLTFKREETELFDNVVMLDDDQIDSLINYDALQDQLTFAPSVVADEFLVGNILIAQRITDSSDSSIYFAKRIISVGEDADTNIVLVVEQANPESIVRSGTLSTELVDTSIQQLKVLNYDNYTITKSKKSSRSLGLETFNVNITIDDNGTEDDKSDDITLSGNVDIQINPTGDFDYGFTGLREFLIVFKVTYTHELTLTMGAGISETFKPITPLFQIVLPPITAGPLVFIPTATIKTEVSLNANISTAITFGLETSATAGIHYRKGVGLTPISGFEIDPFIDFSDLLTGALSAGIEFPIEGKLGLFNLVGPTVTFSPYGTFVAEVAVFDDCPLDMYLKLGGKAKAGGEIGALGKSYSVETTIFDFYYRYDIPGISCGFENDFDPPSAPEVTDYVVEDRVVELQWSASLDDISPVTYTVFRGLNIVGSDISFTQFRDVVPKFDESYCYKIVARDASLNEAISDSKCITVESSVQGPPTTPTNVVVMASSEDINVSWDESAGDSSNASYLIFDSTNSNIKPIYLGNSDVTSFIFQANRSGEYCISVFAIDKVGNVSESSEAECITVGNDSVEDGLVAYYPLIQDLVDLSESKNDGVSIGQPTFQGIGIRLDGIEDYLEFPIQNLSTGFTVSANFKLFENTEEYLSRVPFNKASEAWDTLFAITNSYCDGLQVMYHRNEKFFSIYGAGGCSGIGTVNYELINDVEYSVVVTYDQSAFSIFVDGNLVGSINYSGALPQTGKLTVGRNIIPNTYYFNGEVGDFKIFDRALSADEIQH